MEETETVYTSSHIFPKQ